MLRCDGAEGYDRDAVSRETMTVNKEPSLAKQEFKEECDINVLLERFAITGAMPENVRMPTYGDFMDVPDYQSALNAGREAEQSFMELPAKIRERFQNDPQKLVEFCSDKANLAEAQSLGLVPAPVASDVPPVKPAAPKGAVDPSAS